MHCTGLQVVLAWARYRPCRAASPWAVWNSIALPHVAPPPVWQPFWASCVASGMKLLYLHSFGRAPGGVGDGALPKRERRKNVSFITEL
jgi:hypothetical protein